MESRTESRYTATPREMYQLARRRVSHRGPPKAGRTKYDVIVIGSGAGGGTITNSLARTGATILLLERGDFIPKEDFNWSAEAVWKDLRYRSNDTWLDRRGRPFNPYSHYCVGGNTKFWGSVLYRMRPQDFREMEHVDGVSPAWPIDYETLEPYYARAEHLYHVHGRAGDDPGEGPRGPFPCEPVRHEPAIAEIAERLEEMGLHPAHLPLGVVRPGEANGCKLCNTCNSFPCRIGAKSDAESCAVTHALAHRNVTLWTNALARRLITGRDGKRIEAVEVEYRGSVHRVEAPLIIVSCGAANSAALLLRSANSKHRNGLANSSDLVGRRYMAHLATMMQGFHPFRRNSTVFQKTLAINDFYLSGGDLRFPLGTIQTQGRTHGIMAQRVAPWIPLWAYDAWVARGVDWLVMTEDLPRQENRVTVTSDGGIRLHYQPNNFTAHRALTREMKRILRRLGYWAVMSYSLGARNTTHQCGTLCFGTDPRTSVLDPFCRSHDVENLFVVDASFFPSSAAVNPGLTIVAQALRVADHIRETHFNEVGESHESSIVQPLRHHSVAL